MNGEEFYNEFKRALLATDTQFSAKANLSVTLAKNGIVVHDGTTFVKITLPTFNAAEIEGVAP